MTTVALDNFLSHVGVKGMKWGVRKNESKVAKSSGKSETKAKGELSADQIVFNGLKQKAREGGISSLSNDEIRVLTSRAQALESYNRAFPAPPKKKSKTAKAAEFFVKELVVAPGKSLMKDISKEAFRSAAVKQGLLPKKDQKKTETKED